MAFIRLNSKNRHEHKQNSALFDSWIQLKAQNIFQSHMSELLASKHNLWVHPLLLSHNQSYLFWNVLSNGISFIWPY
jgi:hypothetical protein